MADRPFDPHGGISPDEAFALLGNETRLDVLRVLYRADEPLSFTALRRAVGVGDSGQFNYHLEKLVGHYVREVEDGYELRYAGEEVVRAVLAGVIGGDPTLEPTEIDDRCPYCGATVELRYRDETLTARCTSCEGIGRGPFPDGTFMHYGFPPAGFTDRSLPEVLAAAHTLYDSKATPMMDGVCPECAGRVRSDLDVCEDHDARDGICPACESRHQVWIDYECEHCGYARRCIVWFKLLTHPAVVSFFEKHGGLDATIPFSKLTWDNAEYVRAISESIVSRDPLRVRVDVDLDDAALRIVVDEDVEIVDFQRDV